MPRARPSRAKFPPMGGKANSHARFLARLPTGGKLTAESAQIRRSEAFGPVG